MPKQFAENAETRFQRYQNALTRLSQWEDILDTAYTFSMPNRNGFEDYAKGEVRDAELFDSTAVIGLQNFSNNIISTLMPPFKHWAVLQSGPELPDAERIERDKKLQKVTEIMFRWLNFSNFYQVIYESLLDYGIGTGVIIINEGDNNNPLTFVSVPLDTIAFEEGLHGRLENFWRKFEIPARQILRNWPQAKMTQELNNLLNNSPDLPITVVEGAIVYPQNDDDSKAYYYVHMENSREDLVSEFRPFNPFVGFRFGKTPGEVMGRGPIIQALADIKVLNKMSQFELMANKFNAQPAYIASHTGVINPNNIVLEPGAIIPVEPSFLGNPPIQPIPRSGDVRFMQLSMEQKRQTINELLFSNPLGSQITPNTSATEISIRQQNWLRRSGSAYGRAINELLNPVVERIFDILKRKGLFILQGIEEDIKLDNKITSIRYESPIVDLQAQDDVVRYERWIQLLTSQFGTQGLLGVNINKVPQWLAEKLRVDLELTKDEGGTSQSFQDFADQLQQARQGEQPSDVASPLFGVPEIPSIGAQS